MRDNSTAVVAGDVIDIFSFSVSSLAPAELHQSVGVYQLATITIGYMLASINNGICSSSLATTTTEGKKRVK